MKILHLIAQKPYLTGSGIYLSQTIAGFARQGHEQVVIAGISPEDEPSFPDGVSFFPVRFETPELPFPVAGMSDVMPYPSTRYRNFTEEMAGQFKRAFERRLNEVFDSYIPDLLVCHHLYLATSVAVHVLRARAASDAGLASCKIYAVSHNTDLNQYRQVPMERDYIAEGVRELDRVLALHAPQAEEIAALFQIDPSKLHVVGTGYDDSQFHPAEGLREEGARRLVYVGKIWKQKGVASLLRALDLLPVEKLSSEVVLVGGYSDQAEYDEISALAHASSARVRFAGMVEQGRLVEEYQRANVFVLPSFCEGLPLVILEAMGCGCNVVATKLPGVKEWICSQLPDAPIRFVEPPRMESSTVPLADDLPAFEHRLADALASALDDPTPHVDTSALTWDGVCMRILEV